MSRRDFHLFLGYTLLIVALFSSLIFMPGSIPGNFGDVYSYHYPIRHLVVATLQEGRLPLWNPYIFAGIPLAANSQAVLYYPASVLHYFLPLAWSFSLDAFLHVFAAALGAHLLLRRSGLDSGGAALLAVAYGLSPFLVFRIPQGIPTHLNALSWAPWVWLAALSSNPAWLGLTWAIQVLSGHPQFSLLNGIALGLFVLCRRPRTLVRMAQAAGLALLLSAGQVLPTIEYLRHSIRSIWDPSLAVGYSLTPAFLATFLYPNAFGNPQDPAFALFPSEYFEMLTNYIGLAPLGLALFGLPWLRPAWLLMAVGVFFALGQNNGLYVPLQRALGLDFLRTPSRFTYLTLLGLWLSAGRGWLRARPRLPKYAAAALFAVAALDLAWWIRPWVYAQNPMDYLSSHPSAVKALRAAGGRFATDPDNLTPNKSMQYRLFNVTGYEAFYPAPIALYTAKSERAPAADGSRTYVRRWMTPEMSKLGVTRYVTTRNVVDQTPVFHEGATYIYGNDGALPIVQGTDAARSLSPEHWALRMDKATTVLIAQPVYPGWKLWINGRRSAFRLEEGIFPLIDTLRRDDGPPWIVHFRYHPTSWFAGAWITLAALGAFAAYGLSQLIGRTT
ncbi:MAG: hypothetical protein HY078_08675 [Elusimicrobia bacterium]|nr:hypothetical protein [Elusimicrobiota bacterium]